MPLDFPDSPAVDQAYVSGATTWIFNGTAWELASKETAVQPIETKSDSYELLTTDAGKVIAMNKATAQTVTVGATLDLAVGQRIDIIQTGAGQVTVSASSTTVNGTPGLKFRAQYSAASLLCVGNDSYILMGDLSA